MANIHNSNVVEDTGTEVAARSRARLEVWNPVSLAWERMTQPSGGAGGGGAVTIADGSNVAQGTTTDPSSANTLVGLLKAIKAAVQGTLTVATHAVTQSGVWTMARSWTLSSATDSVNVGNFPATQPVSGTFFQATQPVSGTFFQATQPVSLATNTPDVTDRAARLLGIVDKGKVWDGTNIAAVKAASALAVAADPAFVVQHAPQRADASVLAVTATAAVNTALTLTLPAPAAGLFHYITSIQITKLYSVVGVAAGAGVLITTTNLPGNPVWTTEQLASAAGTAATVVNLVPATPLKSSVAATATTIVAPQQLQTIWRINVTYYTAP